MTARRVLLAYGTRPEIVKLAPVIRALRSAGHDVTVVNTGQHFSVEMNEGIAAEVGLAADVEHVLPEGHGPGGHGVHIGALTANATGDVEAASLDVVMCLGDTETVPAYALAARRAGIPFWHLEAGLRSFNERSVEELFRRLAADAASFNLAPTERARQFLLAEGIPDWRIALVGNPVIDGLVERGLAKVDLADRSGVLLTAHRATNVDDPERLGRIIDIANDLAELFESVRFPVHPRTATMIDHLGMGGRFSSAVERSGPLLPGEFLDALRHCSLTVTDSGGVQEEAAFFGVPVIVLRGSTPRWEGVDLGSVVLVNPENPDAGAVVAEQAKRFATPAERERVDAIACPYGDGMTSKRVADLLSNPPDAALLRLSEPGLPQPGIQQPAGPA